MSDVRIAIELQPWVGEGAPDDFLLECRRTIEPLVESLLGDMGIPGHVAITVILEGSLPAHRIVRVAVDGQQCHFPEELLRWTAGFVTGVPPSSELAVVEAWKKICRTSRASSRKGTGVVGLVADTCLEILKCNVSLFLGPEQVAEYAGSLAPPLRLSVAGDIWPPPASWLGPILRAVLRLRLALSDRRAVATVLADAGSGGGVNDVVESLVACLQPPGCEVHMAPDTLDRFLENDVTALQTLFANVREQMFTENGLDCPEFQLRVAEDLAAGTFAFKIGALRTPPLQALRHDLALVNDTAGRLRQSKIAAVPTLNPATGHPAAIVRLEQRERLGDDRTAWDFHEHFALCLAAALREHGRCFVHRTFARSRLEFIGKFFPATAAALSRAGYTDVRLAPLLRELAGEGISIRNIRRIVDLLIEHAPRRGDERLLIARLRSGLAPQITEKHAGGTDTVVVYLVDPAIEQMVCGSMRGPSESDGEAILDAIRKEMAFLPPTALRPSLLTTQRARSALRGVVVREFPRLPVICFDDLVGAINVQPVARIALS